MMVDAKALCHQQAGLMHLLAGKQMWVKGVSCPFAWTAEGAMAEKPEAGSDAGVVSVTDDTAQCPTDAAPQR
eukprot:365144-Chlamydomonas_euryale.AAC.6